MLETLNHILLFIQQDLFAAFGLISILYLLVLLLPKNAERILQNKIFCGFMISLGMVYWCLWIILIVGALMTHREPDSAATLNRMFGKYWWSFWLQMVLWIGATQLLRLPKFKYRPWLRVLIGLVLLVPVELVVFLWKVNQGGLLKIGLSEDILSIGSGLFLKLGMFICFTQVYYAGFKYVRRLRLQWREEAA